MTTQEISDSTWTVPNILTIIRILLTPVFIMTFVNNRVDVACLIFTLAGITDALDGFLARVLNQRSRLGAFIDPLADKVLLVASFICLAFAGWLPVWLAVLVISRDVIIVGGLAMISLFGVDIKARIKPTMASKVNTTFQIGLVFLILVEKAFFFEWAVVQDLLVPGVAALTVGTGIHYIVVGLILLSSGMDETSGKGGE